jgi:hypothetical protein
MLDNDSKIIKNSQIVQIQMVFIFLMKYFMNPLIAIAFNSMKYVSLPQDSFTNLNESASLFLFAPPWVPLMVSVCPLAFQHMRQAIPISKSNRRRTDVLVHLTQTHNVPIYKFPNDLSHPLSYITA